MLISLSRVVVVLGGRTVLCWYGFSRVEYLEVLLCAQQVSCDCEDRYYTSATVRTLRYVLRQKCSIYLHKSTSSGPLFYSHSWGRTMDLCFKRCLYCMRW
jgi:hypothetical protein